MNHMEAGFHGKGHPPSSLLGLLGKKLNEPFHESWRGVMRDLCDFLQPTHKTQNPPKQLHSVIQPLD